MALFYSAFYDYFTALLRPTLYLFFRDISRKLRNLRSNFRHILNGFICLTFLVEFSFWLSSLCSFIYLDVYIRLIYSDVDIHLFIRTPIGLVPCLNFLSYLATHISL